MINRVLVSVIVPVYNVCNYLERCINSVIAQSETNIELILVDDGSNDGSGDICDNYAKIDNRVKVFHQKNSGRCAARNVGLKNSKGDWIYFLDSDDWIEPDFIKELLEVNKKTGSEIVSCKTQVWKGDDIDKRNIDTNSISILSLDEIIEGLLNQKIVRFELWNKIIKKELLDGVVFLEGQISEEVHIDRYIFMRANSMSHLDKTLHNYLKYRPGNTSSKFNPNRMCVFSELDQMSSELYKLGKNKLTEIINCIEMQFVILIYMEALKFGKIKDIKKQLDLYIDKYYNIAIKSKYFPNHRSLLVFKYFPRLYYYILEYKKIIANK